MTQTPPTAGHAPPSTAAQASLYQTLKTHLTVLKLDACAEALPRVLDEAAAEQLSVTATLERLLVIEVDTAHARRLVGRSVSPASPPRPPSRTTTSTPNPASTAT